MNKRTLFGLDKKGGFKQWSVWTEGNTLFVEHGKLGGKLQLKTEVIEGKNKCRSNETSGEQQAFLEAQSRLSKQLDKGYRENKEDLTELPLLPMLCSDYLKQGHKIKYPCYGSPKLDGCRCLAIRHKGRIELKSRGGKEYSIPHIQQQLMSVMEVGDIWDGELYIHGKYLEEIMSAVKKANEDTPKLQYVIFDIVNDEPYSDRAIGLMRIRRHVLDFKGDVSVLQFAEISDEDHMKEVHKLYVEYGYEGICLRNYDGKYEAGKRSTSLQKYKEFMDVECKIIGVNEDRNGNAVFTVYDKVADAQFTVTYGDFEQRKYQLAHPEDFIGKWLTVKFQTRYKDSKLPQFPCGLAIRDCDEEGNPLT